MLRRRAGLPASGDLINGAWWWVPVHEKRAAADWRDFEGAVARADAVVAQHTWLRAWKAATSTS